MKKSLSFILFFLLSIFCFSQQNFQPGYIITTKGDSIVGFINDQDWVINPSEIKFKRFLQDADELYKPTDLKRFRGSKSFYQSVQVSFEKGLIQRSSEPEMEKGFFFLEVLVLGETTLYYLKESNEKVHFFLSKNGNTNELIERKREIIKDNSKFYNTLDIYKNQLANAFNDCKGIDSKVKYLRYERNAMIKLFQYYYQCSAKISSYAEVSARPKWRWGGNIGASFNKLNFSSSETVFRPVSNANLKAIGFQGGLSAEFIPVKNLQRWSANLELVYQAFQPKDGNISFDFSYINLNVLPRYYFGKNNLNPFVTAGFSYGQAIKAKGILNPGNPEYNELANWRLAVLGGAGISKGSTSIEVRYEKASPITSIPTIRSGINSLYLVATYRFNK